MTRHELIALLREQAKDPRSHIVGNAILAAKNAGSMTESEFHLAVKVKNRIPDPRTRYSSIYADLWRAAPVDLNNLADLLDGKTTEFSLCPTVIST